MGQVHDLLEACGKAGVLRTTDLDRREVEAAAAYLSDEDTGIGFLYSGWCQAALPHRRLPDYQGWQIKTDRVTLVVEPGMRPGRGDTPVHIGVPYGSRARLIMLYLQSEALKTNSREVELGRSLRSWLTKMGISIGGKSVEAVRDQAERISRCRLSFNLHHGRATGLIQQNIVDKALFLEEPDSPQGSLFLETAKLSEPFFEQLKKHPVPIEEAAVRAVNNNSMALDLYAWLAYRLHSLDAPRPITWKALMAQFGQSFRRDYHFRDTFLENLRLALAVYPAARVVIEDKGIVLHPSQPPVVPKTRLIA
jgi:hypothetical protein